MLSSSSVLALLAVASLLTHAQASDVNASAANETDSTCVDLKSFCAAISANDCGQVGALCPASCGRCDSSTPSPVLNPVLSTRNGDFHMIVDADQEM